ncbi:MAG: hypothetical protein M1827_006130 [Pycnora praestabilis]|nr:MAG: hypothetical protein M1827_006130 [Pycnora praestabilis]
MTQSGASAGFNNLGGYTAENAVGSEGRERGARRRKLAGYLKAANELRQSYQQSYGSQWSNKHANADEDAQGIPGAFPDVAIVRSGDEEMVLFPSYARRHVKQERPPSTLDARQDLPSSAQDARPTPDGDAEYWRKEWEKHEDDRAIVDVDIRGWIYSPHRGPMTRKNRMLVGIARHLSGIPAPSGSNYGDGGESAGGDQDTSEHTSHLEKLEARAAKHEAELVEKQAESILKKGEGEANIAWRGGYSEDPTCNSDNASIYSVGSRDSSPTASNRREPLPAQIHHPLSNNSLASNDSNLAASGPLSKRATWSQPADMSPAELSVANAHLMARLKPFLTNPLTSTPITVFFYNEKTSQSRTIVTNEAGHFSLRAALDFVPSNVRVLASENLSAEEEVGITEPAGVSLISDVDDTIKHSAIGNGAKEIFRNTFIRDLGDLTIDGVKEWYQKLAQMGVKMHYVSNSPWQLYPVLVSFFAMAGLPSGSFHLKQYSGMLQGIFEPVAERKKSTLERIMRDFPKRKFLLIGDSGEADLEVYTDVVEANPGRILGVFIRDVTTTPAKGFFDSAMPSSGDRKGRQRSAGSGGGGGPLVALRRSSRSPDKPPLPRRMPTEPMAPTSQQSGPVMGKLIDFDEDPASGQRQQRKHSSPLSRTVSDTDLTEPSTEIFDDIPAKAPSPGPSRPSKPLALRQKSTPAGSMLSNSSKDDSTSNISRKAAPVIPPKPRKYSNAQSSTKPIDANLVPQVQNTPLTHSRESSLERQGYRSSVRAKVSSAYNYLPSASAYWYGSSDQNPPGASSRGAGTDSRTSSTSSAPSVEKPAPPLPPRRGLTSYPVAAAQYASNRLSGGWGGSGEAEEGSGNAQPINKKEEMWKRRWAKAKGIMEGKGVMLKSWRVGGDAVDDAVKLVEKANREMREENKA